MKLLRRIQEHRPLVLLAVLETLSLISLVTEMQASLVRRGVDRGVALTAYPFLKAGQWMSGATQYCYHFVTDHSRVFEENKGLREENVRLRARLAEYAGLAEENARLRKMAAFERAHPEYSLLPANVIQSSMGMLTIDRGRMHGLTAPMCVVTADGVVGTLTEVDDFTSKVATLHDPDCRVGAMVRRNRLRAYDGLIRANSSFRVLCTMEYIDLMSEVRAGDEVVASPESRFPAGYPIGEIAGPPRTTGTLYRVADVRPYVDPYRLDEVFVLTRAAPDPESLAGPHAEDLIWTNPEGVSLVSRAEASPDLRSLQERYAP